MPWLARVNAYNGFPKFQTRHPGPRSYISTRPTATNGLIFNDTLDKSLLEAIAEVARLYGGGASARQVREEQDCRSETMPRRRGRTAVKKKNAHTPESLEL